MHRQIFQYHEVFGYTFIPKLKARIPHEAGGYLLKTNDSGFRCAHNFSDAKTKECSRVLLFGDSFTAGDGVSNNKRFGDLIEQEISAVEIYNYGLSGSGTDQQYLAFNELCSKTEYDVLVIAVLVENIRRVDSHYRYSQNDAGKNVVFEKPYFSLINDQLVLKQCPPAKGPLNEREMPKEDRRKIDRGGRYSSLRRIISKLRLKTIFQKVFKYQPLPEYRSRKNQAWKVMSRILEKWILESEKPVILVPLPLYQHIEGTSSAKDYQKRFSELAKRTGCILHDPLPDLSEYLLSERRNFRFKNDIHPTPSGHAALAESISPKLKDVLKKIK